MLDTKKNPIKDWLPKNTHHTIKTFIESLNKDLDDTQQTTNQRNSLHKEKRRYNYDQSQ